MNRVLSVVTSLLVLTLPVVAQEIGIITLVEGPLKIIRGVSMLQVAEGVRVRAGDIIESSEKGFAQVEINSGPILALGGATRVYLMSSAARSAAARQGVAVELVLLSGWLKGESQSGSGVCRYDTPLLSATTRDGSLVMRSTPELAEMFVESGSAKIGEVAPGGSSREPRAVASGQFASRAAGKDIALAPRPVPAFVDQMPHQFRDTLSSLRSRFTGKPPVPKRDHEVSYAEVQPWLTMPQAWRRGFITRFQGRLENPAFRKALDAHMKDHPEWDPVVHPELYETEKTTAGDQNHKTVRNPR